MKTKWFYREIFDLEYFFHQDRMQDSNMLHQRDRNFFLKTQKQDKAILEADNQELITKWLCGRLTKHFAGPGQRSPGTIFSDSYLVGRNLAIIKGILTGLLAGFSFFSYTGTTPINVFQFLLLFVVSQLGLITLLLTACLLRPLLPGLKIPSFYSVLFRSLATKLVSFFHKQWLTGLTAEKRNSVNHTLGIFRARSSVYGSLFYWPLFCLAQLFGIGFNLGLLGSTLVKISTSDLAFGWQSTMQFSAAAIHKGAMLAALPWSWFISLGTSSPSLAAIEGSRIILKEGIFHLTSSNLVAWWPFLIFCLLFYGLLLRLILLGFGKVMEQYSLSRLQFDTPACQALIRRMQTPLVTTQAQPETEDKRNEPYGKEQSTAISSTHHTPSAQITLISDDIYQLCQTEELAKHLISRGLTIEKTYIFMASYEEDQQLKQLLAEKIWQDDQGIFILMEGWMVPLVSFISYLKEIRHILPSTTIIHLGLLGRPDGTIFTPVTAEDYTIWQQKVEAIGDPYLTFFSLIS